MSVNRLGYYFFSDALYDHNTAHKTGAQSMQDSNMVFYVVPHFDIALRISLIIMMKQKYHEYH